MVTAPSPVSSSNNDVPLWKVFFLVLGAAFICSLFIILGLICHFIYFLCTELINFLKNPFHKPEIKWNHGQGDGTHEKPYCVIIVGAGFSGLGLAIKLKQLNMSEYILYERRQNVGGTWHDNKYPEYLTDKYNLREKIRFNTNVTATEWLDDHHQWKVTINSGQSFYSRLLVSAKGPLANAQFPTNISGVDQFKGDMFHSAEWNTAYDFTEKRVAVIGTGASAVQLVPKIQKHVKQLYVFQRTPPWIVPKMDRKVTDFEKWLFERIPLIQKAIRSVIYWMHESLVLKKLTPTWQLGCKRVLLSNNWCSTLQKPNVQLVTDGIKRVSDRSLYIKQQACQQHNDRLQAKLKKTIWQTGGCKSWYQDKMGNNTAIWPNFTWSYRLIMQNFDYDKYDLFSIHNKKTD
ncbi:unnamed protein product [Didymodactylos carnosus]|uniref:Flavin-containing monooxygenase n=1 Tax=Didymodactylos carnosus TaxID=1234261 RepID=A0A814JHV3_9BILA|nr:unnamed protein product [Didymodactylos carnosus]CAF3808761.1 unnamed protein product [Didymodactylos carnosus]